MINGFPLAPFQHDSSWPDEVVRLFRHAVYRLHVPLPGSDSVCILRQIAYGRGSGSGSPDNAWDYVRNTCDQVVHLLVKGIDSRKEQINIVTNLLSFGNLLLVDEYGLTKNRMSIRYKDESEEALEAAHKKFMENVDEAYQSLELAIDNLRRQPSGKLRGRLNLENSKVLSSIPSSHRLVRTENDSGPVEIVLRFSEPTDVCKYSFQLHDPIGWEMVSGRLDKDKFADDPYSVKKERQQDDR